MRDFKSSELTLSGRRRTAFQCFAIVLGLGLLSVSSSLRSTAGMVAGALTCLLPWAGLVLPRRQSSTYSSETQVTTSVQAAFDAYPDGLLLVNDAGKVLIANQSALSMARESGRFLIGKSFTVLFPAAQERDLLRRLSRVAAAGVTWEWAIRDLCLQANPDALLIAMTPLQCRGGQSDRRDVLLKIRDVSTTPLLIVGDSDDLIDRLTNLPNRQGFSRSAERALQAASADRLFAVLIVDIDRFQAINSCVGHAVADRLLCMVADRIAVSIPEGSLLARLGGDEFIVGVSVREIQSVRSIADLVRRSVSDTFQIDGTSLAITASVGVAIHTDHVLTTADLIMRAENSMYESLNRGGNRVTLYSHEIDERVAQRNKISLSLLSADPQEFYVRYQPKIDMVNRKLVGFEALLRWKRPDDGEILPSSFIAIAEENGMILPLGYRALSLVCAQLKRWGSCALPVALNLSAVQLAEPEFVNRFLATIDDHSISRSLIEVEITESVLISNTEEVCDAISLLRDSGIRVSLDDFGTGYSSLSYLTDFRFDVLKVDRSFVSKLMESSINEAVFEFLVSLSRALNVTLIAEGIETEEQASKLLALGCQHGQGWLFGSPLLVEDATSLLINS